MTFECKCQNKQFSLIFPANINILNDDIDCHNLKYMYIHVVHDETLTFDTEGQSYIVHYTIVHVFSNI